MTTWWIVWVRRSARNVRCFIRRIRRRSLWWTCRCACWTCRWSICSCFYGTSIRNIVQVGSASLRYKTKFDKKKIFKCKKFKIDVSLLLHWLRGGVCTLQILGSVRAWVWLMFKPRAAAPPLKTVQRHCGCAWTTFPSCEQQEDDGVDEFPVM